MRDPSAPGPDDRTAAAAMLVDILVPGDVGWPPASQAIGDLAAFLAGLRPDDAEALSRQGTALGDLAPAARPAAVSRWETDDPAAFVRILAAVYEAYYTSAAALAQVRRLAEAGPREASPYFDPTLLETVIATQAGRRRL